MAKTSKFESGNIIKNDEIINNNVYWKTLFSDSPLVKLADAGTAISDSVGCDDLSVLVNRWGRREWFWTESDSIRLLPILLGMCWW